MCEYGITGTNPWGLWGHEAGETVNIAVRKEDEEYTVGKNTYHTYNLGEVGTISKRDRVMLACDFYTECMNIVIDKAYADAEMFSESVEFDNFDKFDIAKAVACIFGSDYILECLNEDDTSFIAESLRLICQHNIKRSNKYEVSLVWHNPGSPLPQVAGIIN